MRYYPYLNSKPSNTPKQIIVLKYLTHPLLCSGVYQYLIKQKILPGEYGQSLPMHITFKTLCWTRYRVNVTLNNTFCMILSDVILLSGHKDIVECGIHNLVKWSTRGSLKMIR